MNVAKPRLRWLKRKENDLRRSEVFTVVTMKIALFWDVGAATCSRWFLARGFFYPEDGGDMFLRNFGLH
jgi:hypothetical protein